METYGVETYQEWMASLPFLTLLCTTDTQRQILACRGVLASVLPFMMPTTKCCQRLQVCHFSDLLLAAYAHCIWLTGQ